MTQHTQDLWVNVYQSCKGEFIEKFTSTESEYRGETTIWPELALKYDTKEQAELALKDDDFYRGFFPMTLKEVENINRKAIAKARGE